MTERTAPLAAPGRWEVRRRDSAHSVIGVFVEAQTAFHAWQEALPSLAGAPSFAECDCNYLGEQSS